MLDLGRRKVKARSRTDNSTSTYSATTSSQPSSWGPTPTVGGSNAEQQHPLWENSYVTTGSYERLEKYGGVAYPWVKQQHKNNNRKRRASCGEPQLYGLPIPAPPPEDTCTACYEAGRVDGVDKIGHGQQENSEYYHPVSILCDAPGCNREYHISCAGLWAAPEHGSWYCRDCHPQGGTDVEMLEAVIQFNDEMYFDFCLNFPACEELDEEREHQPEEVGHAAADITGTGQRRESSRQKIKREGNGMLLPEGPPGYITLKDGEELTRKEMIEQAFLWRVVHTFDHQPPPRTGVEAEAVAIWWRKSFDCPWFKRPEDVIGKPVRMRVSNILLRQPWISGRIVDSRDGGSEFLVHWSPEVGHGADERPKGHWLRLHEHCLMIGVGIILDQATGKPKIVWERSRRLVLWSSASLRKAGCSRSRQGSTINSESHALPPSDPAASPSTHPWLVSSIGLQDYSWIPRQQDCAMSHTDMVRQQPHTQFRFEWFQAIAEKNAQENIQKAWKTKKAHKEKFYAGCNPQSSVPIVSPYNLVQTDSKLPHCVPNNRSYLDSEKLSIYLDGASIVRTIQMTRHV